MYYINAPHKARVVYLELDFGAVGGFADLMAYNDRYKVIYRQELVVYKTSIA